MQSTGIGAVDAALYAYESEFKMVPNNRVLSKDNIQTLTITTN